MRKDYRIKKNQEIENIIKGKKKTGNKNYIIYIKENSEAKHFRLATSVSKKIGNAVTRNRQKRLIRQVFNQFKERILPFDIFVIAKSNAITLTYDEVMEEICNLLSRLKVLNEGK
jgi:ribonuclease P protein component